MRALQSPTKLTCADAGAAASSTTIAAYRQRVILTPLLHLSLRARALQMVVQIREAHDLLDVAVIHAIEPFRALPLAFPVLRVGHRVRNLELLATGKQAEPLDDAQLFTRWNRRAALIHPMVIA